MKATTKWKFSSKFEAFLGFDNKMVALSNFSKSCLKSILWLIFLTLWKRVFASYKMCLIHSKDNETVFNWGNKSFCFTTNGQLKMLLHRFRYFHFYNFGMVFAKILWRNCHFSIQILKVLLKFYYVTKF